MDNTDRLFIGIMVILMMVHSCAMNLSQAFTLDKVVKEIKASVEEVKQQSYKGIK